MYRSFAVLVTCALADHSLHDTYNSLNKLELPK